LTDDLDWQMELSTHSVDQVEADIGSTHQRVYDLRRYRNLLASPLLHLPTELIVKIFGYAIDSDYEDDGNTDDNTDDSDESDDGSSSTEERPTLLVLTGICHKLREIGTTTPRLWSTIHLAAPSLTKLFLEKCNYDPRILIALRSPYNEREATWKQLDGCTFKNLRSLVFKGSISQFNHRAIPLLQGAANLSGLEVQNVDRIGSPLPWNPTTPIPLSTLRLRGCSISWTSPLLQNLTRLTLDCSPFEHTPIETFLAVLAKCPDLESLELSNTGPDPPSDHRDNRDAVIQLCRLRRLSLNFWKPSTVGHILSHIGYPESVRVKVFTSVAGGDDLSEIISQVIPHDTDTFRHFQRSKALTIRLGNIYKFSTDQLRCLEIRWRRPSQDFVGLISKSLELVGKDTVVSLSVKTLCIDLTYEFWEGLLHGLPRLKQIKYQPYGGARSDSIESFISVLSQPFEGGPICPELQDLESSKKVLTWNPSLLKHALAKREALGKRLKRIGFSGTWMKEDDIQVLALFQNHVDEARCYI
jgi:hypothetical protein